MAREIHGSIMMNCGLEVRNRWWENLQKTGWKLWIALEDPHDKYWDGVSDSILVEGSGFVFFAGLCTTSCLNYWWHWVTVLGDCCRINVWGPTWRHSTLNVGKNPLFYDNFLVSLAVWITSNWAQLVWGQLMNAALEWFPWAAFHNILHSVGC